MRAFTDSDGETLDMKIERNMLHVRADEVQVGDIIWKEQRNVVTRVRHLSVSTAIDTTATDKPGLFVQWLLANELQVPITRPEASLEEWLDIGGEG